MLDKIFKKKSSEENIIITITNNGITNKITIYDNEINLAIHRESDPMIMALSKFIMKKTGDFINNPFDKMCEDIDEKGKFIKEMLKNLDNNKPN